MGSGQQARQDSQCPQGSALPASHNKAAAKTRAVKTADTARTAKRAHAASALAEAAAAVLYFSCPIISFQFILSLITCITKHPSDYILFGCNAVSGVACPNRISSAISSRVLSTLRTVV